MNIPTLETLDVRGTLLMTGGFAPRFLPLNIYWNLARAL